MTGVIAGCLIHVESANVRKEAGDEKEAFLDCFVEPLFSASASVRLRPSRGRARATPVRTPIGFLNQPGTG